MAAISTGGPDARLRHARTAVGACFFANAVLYANLVPRLPELKAELGLSNTALGTALAAQPLGALVAGVAVAPLMTRLGSARIAGGGLVLLAAAVWAAAAAPQWGVLAGALLVAGAVDAAVDVAQNAQGLRVQRRYGRSIINAFHGTWSVGSLAGGLLGAAAAGLGVPLSWHLGVVAVLVAVPALAGVRLLLPGSDDPPPDASAPRPRARARSRAVVGIAALGALAACAVVVEDAGSSWSALYLRVELDAGPAVAGLGFVALSLAMTVGRFTGDRAVDRFGRRRVVQAGGLLSAVGFGAALAMPSVPSTLAGFALAGLGVATLVPAAYTAADELPGLRPGLGLAVVNVLLRTGFLVVPPLVGVIADASSLRVALLAVVVAGVGTALLARSVPRG
ncbi:MFS transporter [Blastococcus sp. TML/M2B]|uniref:MFS transporter n=1 Tax=unclassified Blastococcus TaxID=2619396 RepID=UPI0019091EE7|nr:MULTISPECIES: MFS transporter [unclassified Blastococcus]MBN1093692.1 MFS transporter [Blastococcus sp. TML/M2B]MBN1096188.1 MFS transporter [Blastococcus sp. TML/C7B]